MKTSIDHKTLGSLDIFELNCGDAQLGLSSFGAQALYWRINGKDVFFNNPKLIVDKSKALRGGAPICFPWFNKGNNWKFAKELVPSHGSARSSNWQKTTEKINNDSCAVEFLYNTMSALNLPLSIKVTYLFFADNLKIEFVVTNLSPDSDNSFELALHSYFATNQPDSVEINGLADFSNQDFVPQIPIDQIFTNLGNQLSAKFKEFNLAVTNQGFNQSVVWHPGKEHTLTDLPSIHPVPFLCIESLTEIVNLDPESGWAGSVNYIVKFDQ